MRTERSDVNTPSDIESTIPGFVTIPGYPTHWYQCKNPDCKRWFNINLWSSGRPDDDYSEGYVMPMNLHLMYCPKCGYKQAT